MGKLKKVPWKLGRVCLVSVGDNWYEAIGGTSVDGGKVWAIPDVTGEGYASVGAHQYARTAFAPHQCRKCYGDHHAHDDGCLAQCECGYVPVDDRGIEPANKITTANNQ